MQTKVVLIAIVLIAISSIGCPPQKSDITVTASLVAMSTTLVTESSGGLIWSSSIQNEVYYYFYLRNADDSIQLHRVLANHKSVFIIEDTEVHEAEDAFVTVTISTTKSELDISEYPDFAEYSWKLKRLEIHLPPGTIVPVLGADIT